MVADHLPHQASLTIFKHLSATHSQYEPTIRFDKGMLKMLKHFRCTFLHIFQDITPLPRHLAGFISRSQ